MTALEMHVEVNQQLQLISANRTRKFLTQEIDWVLNKIQNRFIQESVRPVLVDGRNVGKYAIDQFKLDALKNLIVSNKTLVAYKDLVAQPERSKSYLPDDYMYLLSDSSVLINTCNATATPTTAITTVTFLQLSQSAGASSPYYQTSALTVGGSILSIPSGLNQPNQYTGYIQKDEVIFLRDWYLTKMRQAGIEVYWERYGDLYKQGYFIFIGTPSPLILSHDGIVVTTVTTYSFNRTAYSASAVVYKDNRLVDSSVTGTLLNTPYYKSSIESPVSELSKSFLYTYYGTNTIVKSTIISYVRKPQPISLSLGLNCELSEEFHPTICDLAVEYIKGTLKEGDGRQLKTQDIETRVIL
jgi:hypothetical protein